MLKKMIVFLSVVFVMISGISFADTVNDEIDLASVMSDCSFDASNGIKLPYRLYIPENYDKNKKYSFLLHLHGAGNRGNDNLSQIKEHCGLIRRIIGGEEIVYNDLKINSADEFIIVVPQCGTDFQWVDTPWDKAPDPSWSTGDVGVSKYMIAVEELMVDIFEKYNVNEERLYVTGLSMGGFGTWDLIMRYPDMWAAAIPMGGGADLSMAEEIKDVPIWTFHQMLDSVVLSQGTQNIVSKLVEVGGDIKFTPYFEKQHNAWTKGYASDDMINWLYSNKKSDKIAKDKESVISSASEWAKHELGLAYAIGLMPECVVGDFHTDITREDFCETVVSMIPAEYEGDRYAAFDDTDNVAVSRAYSLGIVNGISDTKFSPDEYISREQMCAMLYRAYKIIAPDAVFESLKEYHDAKLVSAWAKDAVEFIVNSSIVSEDENKNVNPQNNITREEAVILVYRTFYSANSYGK